MRSFMILLVFQAFIQAEIIYATEKVIGYDLAQEVLAKLPRAQEHEYRIVCNHLAREKARMGININPKTLTRICLRYIKNPKLKPPLKKDPEILLNSVKSFQ